MISNSQGMRISSKYSNSLIRLTESKYFDMSSSITHILQLSAGIVFTVIILSANTCLLFNLPSWYAAYHFEIVSFMWFYMLSIRMMVSIFLITDRSTIGLTLMLTSFLARLASSVKIPSFISIGQYSLMFNMCSAYFQFVCKLAQVYISEVACILYFHTFCYSSVSLLPSSLLLCE